ncbi:MAG: lysylphosphatidylglycerol synthase transmembrane domain-containing protein [Myxococcota bacterium]
MNSPPDAPPAPPPRAQKRSALAWVIKALVALLVSGVALWFAFKDVDLRSLGQKLQKTDLVVLSIFVLAQVVIHAVRIWRWAILIRPLGNPTWRAIFSASSVGIPASMFLPLRLGEFVRPVMIARSGVPFAGAVASVVTERVADGLTNVGLFFMLLALMPTNSTLPDEVRLMAKIAFIGFGGACALLVVMAYAQKQAMALLARVVDPIAPHLSERLAHLFSVFLDGLRPLYQPTRLVLFVLLTAVYWGINGLTTTLLAKSYGIDVPWIAGPFAVVIVVFAVTLPAGPAFAGTLQVGFLLGLKPFGVSPADAALVAIAIHLVQIVSQALLMGLGFLTADPRARHHVLDVPEAGPEVDARDPPGTI